MKNRLYVPALLAVLILFSSAGWHRASAAQPQVPAGTKVIGAKAAKADQSLTLQDMLTYAMEDEYLARARYGAVVEKFGARRPFTNIIRAENVHIEHLKPLFSRYNVTVPQDNAREYVTEPKSLKESFEAGVQGEIENIEMYERFLMEDLPPDVKAVFTRLRNASRNHLMAFQKGLRSIE